MRKQALTTTLTQSLERLRTRSAVRCTCPLRPLSERAGGGGGDLFRSLSRSLSVVSAHSDAKKCQKCPIENAGRGAAHAPRSKSCDGRSPSNSPPEWQNARNGFLEVG